MESKEIVNKLTEMSKDFLLQGIKEKYLTISRMQFNKLNDEWQIERDKTENEIFFYRGCRGIMGEPPEYMFQFGEVIFYIKKGVNSDI